MKKESLKRQSGHFLVPLQAAEASRTSSGVSQECGRNRVQATTASALETVAFASRSVFNSAVSYVETYLRIRIFRQIRE